MSSTSETGHAKNLANFKLLISFTVSYGSKYIPSKKVLVVVNLQAKFESCNASQSQLKDGETNFKNKTNNRVIGFKDIKIFCTQIINALAATDASAETVKDARGYNRKIQGKRAIDKEQPLETSENAPLPSDKKISVSQLSYDSLVDNFEKLVNFVVADPSYQPNETELTATALVDKLAFYKSLNDDVVNAFTNLSNKRNARNEEFYNPETGLVKTAQGVKKYVLSVYKANSIEYKQVNRIRFKGR